MDREHLVEVLGVLNQLFIELAHLRIDVGRMVEGELEDRTHGEEADLSTQRPVVKEAMVVFY